ncbi:MAG: TauD/TfdA family dioxygenase [Burkholderiaceae bacterium]
MNYERITVKPVTPTIGAEIEGVRLGQSLDAQTCAELRRAWLEHQVIFFRDQALDHDGLKAFGRSFGELDIHPSLPGPPGHPEILPIHTDANSSYIAGEAWHSDVTYDAVPPTGSILYLHTVPPSGGDTLFANMGAAYEALSDRLKAYLEGLTAHHGSEHRFRGRFADRLGDDTGKVYPQADHPVVRTHPETGRRILFVNPWFTTRINELPALESDAMLRMLYEHINDPIHQVRFRWRPGSVAFWDNRSVQHMALWDYRGQVRSGFRITLEGSPDPQ